MSSRQLRNIVQEAFDIAYEKMLSEGHREESKALQSATTHWLRHTGASEDCSSTLWRGYENLFLCDI